MAQPEHLHGTKAPAMSISGLPQPSLSNFTQRAYQSPAFPPSGPVPSSSSTGLDLNLNAVPANEPPSNRFSANTEEEDPDLTADESFDPLNTDDVSRIPPLGAKFKTRAAFETACRSAVPATADWAFRIWKSLEVETSRRYGKNAFVELGCRHKDNTKCSSATFRIRAVHNKEGDWVIVKRTTTHDNHGPLGPRKRRGGNRHNTRKSIGSDRSLSVSRSTTPGLDMDDSAESIDTAMTSRLRRSRSPLSPFTYQEDDGDDRDLSADQAFEDATESGPAVKKRKTRGSNSGVGNDSSLQPPTSQRSRHPPPVKFTLPPVMPHVQEPLYCYCNYTAYDDMAECSGENCEKQWFHLGCIGRAEMPPAGWKCFDCSEREEKGDVSPETRRPADSLFHNQLLALSTVAAAALPIEQAPHGPLVAFLNSLNPTLGDACGLVLYNKGLTSPTRFLGMDVSQWNSFLKDVKADGSLSTFDFFTLQRTMTAWLQHQGYSALNKV